MYNVCIFSPSGIHILFCDKGLYSFLICPPKPFAQQHLLLNCSLLGRTGARAARFKSCVFSMMLLCGKKKNPAGWGVDKGNMSWET